MTVRELKQQLEKYPEDMTVFMDERVTSFQYGLLNGVRSQRIEYFKEEMDTEPESSEICVILSEE